MTTKLVQTRKQTSTGVGFQFRVVANYTYDAYGSVTVSSPISGEDLGVVNPLRYKNYIYDTETDWYYLQTRFYDPAVGRFLNADGYADTGDSTTSTNMFAYCGNNPIIRKDSSGQGWTLALTVAITAIKVIATKIKAKKNGVNEKEKFKKKLYKAIKEEPVSLSKDETPVIKGQDKYKRYRIDFSQSGTEELYTMPDVVKQVAEQKLQETGYGYSDQDIKQFVGELYAHEIGYEMSFHLSENLKIADIDVHPIRGVFDKRWTANVISWTVGEVS